MNRKLIAKILVVVLMFTMIGSNVFVSNIKAEPEGGNNTTEELLNNEEIVSAFSDSVGAQYRVLYKNINTSLLNPYNEYVKTEKSSDGLPSAYTAPYTSVKRQHPYGSCWVFGAINAAESNLLSKEKDANENPKYNGGLVGVDPDTGNQTDPIDLSEAQAVYTFTHGEHNYDGTDKSYSSNDYRHVLSSKEELQGFSGGGLPIDSATVLCADKGSLLEKDNIFLTAAPDSVEGATSMAKVAKQKYSFNRFHIKSVEQLPEVYPETAIDGNDLMVQETNPDARNVWKEKIINNGAIYAKFWKSKENELVPEGTISEDDANLLNRVNELNESNDQESTEEETTMQNATGQETTVQESSVSSEVPTIESDDDDEGPTKVSETSSGQKETPTFDMDVVNKYYHSWQYGDDPYCAKDYRPNYWFFSQRQGTGRENYTGEKIQNHVVSIVGYDDKYSKYNFAEKLIDPKDGSVRNYNPDIAKVEILIEDLDGNLLVDFDPDNPGHEMTTAETTSNLENENGKNYKYNAYIVPKDDGAWIVKNSYGTTKNGKKKFDDGIMHVSYDEASLIEPTSIVVEESLAQIQNEELEHDATLTHSSLKGFPIRGLNKDTEVSEVFTVDKKMTINQVGYWTGVDNTITNIRICKLSSDNQDPESNDILFNSTDGIEDEYGGYHTLALDEPINVDKSERISVIISQSHNNESALMMESDRADVGNGYKYKANLGDTYMKTEEGWVDLQEDKEGGIKELANNLKPRISICNSTVKLLGVADKYNVENYKSTDEYTYPEEKGKVFAGWYDNALCTKLHTSNTGFAYPKFIDKNVLKVKGQLSGDRSAVRFVSSIDHLDYQQIGFIINATYDGHPIDVEKTTNKVYKKITAGSIKVEPQYYCDTSDYMFAYTVRGMNPTTESTWDITPFFITPDGTKVTGSTRNWELPLKQNNQ